LEAAGLMAVHPARAFDAEGLAPHRDGLERLLSAHEPYPGLVLDGHWRVLLANAGATRLFGAVDGCEPGRVDGDRGTPTGQRTGHGRVARERLRQQLREHPTDEELARLVAVAEQAGGDASPPSGEVVMCPTFLIAGRE
jgi:hypothetical protein